jgi:two-component system, sensor histidine kinase LadS
MHTLFQPPFYACLRAKLRLLASTTARTGGMLALWLTVLAHPTCLFAAPSTPLPTIELGARVQRVEMDTLSQYWIDDSGQASIEQVAAAQGSPAVFTPRSYAQGHALGKKALWIRFDTLTTDAQVRWFVAMVFPTLDDAMLYWQDKDKQWLSLRTGTLALPHALWPVADRFPMFPLNHDSAAAATSYYLRIAHDRVPYSGALHIYRDTALLQERQTGHFLLGIYFGLLLLVVVVCTTMATTTRDSSFAYYAAYVLVLGLGQASLTGLAAQYLWPHWPGWAHAAKVFLPGLSTAAFLWFMHSTMQLKVLFPRLDTVVLLMAGAQLLALALYLLYPSILAFQVISSITLVTTLPILMVAWFGWTRGDAGMRWLALGLLPILIGVFPLLLRNLGLMNTNFFTQYGVMLGSSVEMPILLYGLIRRSASRREGQARAAGLPTRDALTSLYNTRGLLRRIHGALTRATRFRHQYGLILVELSNYEWFAREHGREMGERALVLLANRLQYIARDVDAAARIDDHHFILLIEGPCPATLAIKIATQIAASAHRPTDLLPVGASLKLRITCALLPDANSLASGHDDASAQLGWLVHRSEALVANPLKLVRTLNF